MTTSTRAQKLALGKLIFGRPLATEELGEQAISNVVGLAVFASDALSSTAYATEEILVVLVAAGAASFNLSIPIAFAIALLLVIVTLSYRQTIHAYPNGGGAYIVSKTNFGPLAAQVAGAALLTDYVLTVAVSISSGVAQIASGIPGLQDYRIEIALLVIFVMTIINLRGVKESGRVFAVPTYFFLVMAFLLLGVALFQYLTGHLVPVKNVQDAIVPGTEALTGFLILRAFSSGCTALTGVEAISNGIPAFKEPKSNNAATTLTWMSGILITLFLGLTLLAHQVQAAPSTSETVISQVARAIYGDNSLMYFLMLSGTSLILLMAANTSYADFPRLAALQAADGFLPRQLGIKGSRLVFKWGIIVLGALASVLVVFFRADTTALIPLYAIGVFLSFTMSQSGMVVHNWRRRQQNPPLIKEMPVTTGKATHITGEHQMLPVYEYNPHWKREITISGLGAAVTGVVMFVFVITKFAEGAWFVTLLIPCMVFVFYRVHRHYTNVALRLKLNGRRPTHRIGKVKRILLVDSIHLGTLAMVDYAKSLGESWEAIHIAIDPDNTEKVLQRWEQYVRRGNPDIPNLEIIASPFRQLVKPLKEKVEFELELAGEGYVNVIMGHLVMDSYWEQALHQNSQITLDLMLQEIPHVVVTKVPYQIHNADDVPHGTPPPPTTAALPAN